MNAFENVASREPIVLRLPASKLMPRKLLLCWRQFDAEATLIGPAGAPHLAYTLAPHADCRLRRASDGTTDLWIGTTSFDLTNEEAAVVERMFRPHGLARKDGV